MTKKNGYISAIGETIERVEDARLISGNGRFVDNISLPETASIFFIRSPHAHARIDKIDKTAALISPGVLAVISAEELALENLGNIVCLSFPKEDPEKAFCPERPLLASDYVRFVGEGVVMVVAETLNAAKDAAELVEVSYTPLPGVTLVNAFKENSSKVWASAAGNCAFSFKSGDYDLVNYHFKRAAHITEKRIVYPRVTSNSLEPRCCIAWRDPLDGRLVLHTSTQEPWGLKDCIAKILKLSTLNLRIVTADVGGGFGMKGQVYPEDILVVWAARKLKRAVKWTAERSEAMATDSHGRGPIANAALALDKAGKFLGLRIEVDVDVGAYLCGWAAVPPRNAVISYPGMYDVPHIYASVRATYTNTSFLGPYRGSGKPEATFILECLVEQAAREMEFDRIKLRKINLIQKEFMPYKTSGGYTYDVGDFDSVLESALELSEWQSFPNRQRETEESGFYRGIGLSLHCQRAGTFSERMEIRIDPESMVSLHVGTQSTGQGHETMFAQMASGWFGLPIEKIKVVQGDTDKVAFGRGTFAQRSMATGGSALKIAADIVLQKAKKFAAVILEASVEDIVFKRGEFFVVGTDKITDFKQVAAFSYLGSGLPEELGIGLEGIGSFEGTYTFPNGCIIAEVEVDPETGVVTLEKIVSVDDIGTVVNPLTAHGQLHGSIAMGVGEALVEEIIYDRETGQLLTGSFMDYCMPRADNLPNIISSFSNKPSKNNPLGIKGGSEAGNCGVPAAVFHAIQNALTPLDYKGIQLPCRSERVWRALGGV